jgi:ribosomal protein S18 acetylase RimI-like enzyme
MTDVTVRTARPNEYERVGDLTVDAYRALPGDHLSDGYEAQIRDVATRAQTTDVLVAVDVDGKLLGACTFVSEPASPWMEWTEPNEVELRLLAVDPAARGLGVGQLLLDAVLERVRALDRPLVLHSTQHMTAAQHLYVRNGFVRTPERDENDVLPGYEFRAYRFVPGDGSSDQVG